MTACQRGNSKAPHRTGEHLFDIGRRPKTQHRTPPSRDLPPLHSRPLITTKTVGATALDLEQPATVRAATDADDGLPGRWRILGLLKGTPFDFGKEWTKEGMTEQQKGSIEECMSEATMEKYMMGCDSR